jgi:hypothetical protein
MNAIRPQRRPPAGRSAIESPVRLGAVGAGARGRCTVPFGIEATGAGAAAAANGDGICGGSVEYCGCGAAGAAIGIGASSGILAVGAT